ncbi:MAG: ABC transporter ATP-binding protein [Myxococcota bacterium]
MLQVTDLVKRFRDPGRGMVTAVDQLTFKVEPGEVYGLLGPNGAGKTTTLRMIATLLNPDSGAIHIGGVDRVANPLAARGQLAFVPAEAGLPDRLRPREVVRLFARVQGVKDPKATADALLERLGAASFADTPCADLSTGMKRRVVLARALVHAPSVLLLDEPTDGLDVPGRREVLALVREQAAEGRAVVLSSHIMGEVEKVVDRIGMVKAGKIVAEGTVAQVLQQAGADDLDDAFVSLMDAPS